jgi:hypothetical protein
MDYAALLHGSLHGMEDFKHGGHNNFKRTEKTNPKEGNCNDWVLQNT